MGQPPKVDDRFLKPLYLVAKAVKMSEIPLLVMRASDCVVFLDQASQAMGGTVIYASQPQFVDQALASMAEPDYLFVVIDQPLGTEPYRFVHAYLSARDIMGADPSEFAGGFNAEPPHPEHRMILLIDQLVFNRQESRTQRELRELCTVVAVS